jgi:hypothetical protein
MSATARTGVGDLANGLTGSPGVRIIGGLFSHGGALHANELHRGTSLTARLVLLEGDPAGPVPADFFCLGSRS